MQPVSTKCARRKGGLPAWTGILSCVGALIFGPALRAQVDYVETNVTVQTIGGGPVAVCGRSSGSANGNTFLNSQFHGPVALALDSQGDLFIADKTNNAVRMVTAAGNTGGSLTSTYLSGMTGVIGVAVDAADSLYVLTQTDQKLRKYNRLGNELFSYALPFVPSSLVVAQDAATNIFVTFSDGTLLKLTQNGVSILATTTIVSSGFGWSPAGIAWRSDGMLAVSDHLKNSIYLVPSVANSTPVVYTGGPAAGWVDGAAGFAQFNQPTGLVWTSDGQLVVADTANNALRRIDPSGNASTIYGVKSTQWGPGDCQDGIYAGWVDGAPGSFRTNATGRSVAAVVLAPGGTLFVTELFYDLLRQVEGIGLTPQTTPPAPPPVSNPTIGFVTFPSVGGTPLSVFNVATEQTFDNAVIIAIKAENGVQTYMTFGPTPVSPFDNPIPIPGPGSGNTPQIYAGDGLPPDQTHPSVLAPEPDVTMYVVSDAPNRTPSQVVSARFHFITANPAIGSDNAAAVPLTDDTTNAFMWYTLDGSTPTNDGSNGIGPISSGQVISFPVTTNVTLSVRAFNPGFAPSGIVVQSFSASNFVANEISFGFAGGEASSQFLAAAGQKYYVPVTLSVLPATKMYSLQFNVVVTNLGAAPPVGLDYTFASMLVQPVTLPSGTAGYQIIPPEGSTGIALQSLLFTNSSINLLGVGWLEIIGETNLYPTPSQDLISFSLAHENLFLSANGKIIVGGYSFVIPPAATLGQAYQIQLGRPSADGDGFAENVFIQTPTNGTLGAGTVNSIKNVTVAIIPYLVGDVAPFRWFNAGDFGDSNLLNNDVLEVFRAAVYHLNAPPVGSDFFNAMDSSDGSDNNYYIGDDTLINNIKFGDGSLNVDDVYVTYRRSLDPSLTWYQRFWSNGVLRAQSVPNVAAPSKARTPAPPPMRADVSGPRYITVGADQVQAGANRTISVPIRLLAGDSLPVRVMMMNLDLIPLDGSPAITNTIAFSPVSGLGSPDMTLSQGPNNYAATWLNSSNSGVAGSNLLGTVTVTLPPNVSPNSSYLVHFEHLSASPNGLALFHTTLQDGLITVADRSVSSWGDGIPDSWRLIYFGTVSNLLSAANLDPDGDGASNWQEYVAGTNPQDPASVFQLGASPASPSVNFTLQWPSVVGKTYVLEASTSLFSTNWSVISSNLLGNGQMMQFTDPAPSSQFKFFRARVQ